MPRRESKSDKALRLIAERRIVEGLATTYLVIGDDGRYITTILHRRNDDGSKGEPFHGTCTCKWTREHPNSRVDCYHIIAGKALAKRFKTDVTQGDTD